MKKIYLFLILLGTGYFALSIPNIGNKINTIFKEIKKEKSGKKTVDIPQKANNKGKNIRPKAKKIGVVAASVSAVQTVAVEGGGNAVPGGQLNYSFFVSNSESTAAYNVTFTDQLIADLTLVAGSVKATPIAGNDAYSVTGNVGITVPAASGVMANDNSPTGLAMTVAVATNVANGVLNLASDGSFTYLPTAGYVGADSFTYTLTTGAGANLTTSIGTVNLTIANMFWFVNPTVGASGTGTLQSPFKNMSDITGTAAGNTIFVYAGSPTGAVTLLNNQKLVGQGASAPLVGPGSITGVTVQPFSNSFPSTGGARPTWTHNATALTLASTNDIEGIDITTTGGTSVTGASVGDLKVKEVALNNTNGQALQIGAGGALNIIFDYISSANGAKSISVNNSTGSFQIIGTGATTGTGGTILSKTTRGAEFINCTNITLKNMNFTSANTSDGIISNTDNTAANAAIHGNTVNGFTLNNIAVSGTTSQIGLNLSTCSNVSVINSSFANCGTTGTTEEGGIIAKNLSGTCYISGVNVTTSGGRNVFVKNSGNTSLSSLTVTYSTFNTANGDANFFFEGNGTSNSTVTFKANSFINPISNTLAINANGSCTINAQVGGSSVADGNTLTAKTVAPGSNGLYIQGSGTANVNYNVINNTIESSLNGPFPINIGNQGTGGQFMGRINNNTVTYIGTGNNNGIFVAAYGRAKHISEIKNNTVNNTLNYGIAAETNDNNTPSADGTMDVTIQNNIVNMRNGGLAYAHYNLTSNNFGPSSGNMVTCGNMSGNTSNNVVVATNLELSSNVVGVPASRAVIKVQGGISTLPAAWTTPNPAGGPTAIDAGGGGTITLAGSFTCLVPTNPAAARFGVEEIAGTENKPVENTNETPINEEITTDQSGINTDFGVNKSFNSEVKPVINTNASQPSGAKIKSGETITINGSGSGFTIPAGKSTTISFSATINNPTVACDMTNIASVSGSNFTTANSNSTSVPLVIPPINTGSTISATSVCSGGTISLTAACPAGSTLNWYNAASGGSIVNSASPYNPTNITVATDYYASCTIGACESVRTLVGSVSINALPDATITADAAVCQFGTANLSVPATGLASVIWAGTGLTSTNTNPTTAKPIFIGNVTYDVFVTDINGCTATASTQVTVNPTPLVTAGTDQTVCEDVQVTLQGNCIYNVYGVLSGAAEVPANNSAGKGMVSGYYDANTNTLVLTLFYSGLSGTASNAHIHGPAAVGVNNGVLQGLTGFTFGSNSGSYSQSFTNVSYGAAIIAGQTYVNIHSTAFGGGELRAQLTAVCSGDEFKWNPGNLSGLSVNVTPPLPEETYTLTAKNSVTGCENNTPATVIISVDPVTLPTGPTINTQNVANVQLISNACEYVARVVPTSGGFTDATVKSFVESTPPYAYVPRHFQITPATNPSTATGNITLFFTQKDFNDYNGTIGSNLFPITPVDNAGIANIQIVKVPDGGGTPLIIPTNGTDWNSVSGYTVIWNAALEIWEVTFPVTGFSEFYAKSAATPLPVNLISFTGKATEKGNQLNWKTTNEKAFSHFEIQRSNNAYKFDSIGEIKGNNSEYYQFIDNQANGINYYRLKMIDLDGRYNYSKTISIENNIGRTIVGNFYPNPSAGKTFVEINATEKGNWNITTFDVTGKALKTEQKLLEKGKNIITLEKLQQGVNFVKFESGVVSEIRKVIKE